MSDEYPGELALPYVPAEYPFVPPPGIDPELSNEPILGSALYLGFGE